MRIHVNCVTATMGILTSLLAHAQQRHACQATGSTLVAVQFLRTARMSAPMTTTETTTMTSMFMVRATFANTGSTAIKLMQTMPMAWPTALVATCACMGDDMSGDDAGMPKMTFLVTAG